MITKTMNTTYNTSKPNWLGELKVKQEFDVREMLAKGEQPVVRVMADFNVLPQGTIYKLIAPFLPAPIKDKASSMLAEPWIVKESEELYLIYFCKPGS